MDRGRPVGLVLFWPALIGMAATKDRKEELARLKGEYDAVDAQARMRHCTMPIPGTTPFAPAAPPAGASGGAIAALPADRDIVLSSAPPPVRRRNLGLEVLAMDTQLAGSANLAEAKGVYVMSVIADGAAASGGLRQHDVILDFAAVPVASVADMQRALAGVRAGSRVPVTIWRDQRRVQAQLAF